MIEGQYASIKKFIIDKKIINNDEMSKGRYKLFNINDEVVELWKMWKLIYFCDVGAKTDVLVVLPFRHVI